MRKFLVLAVFISVIEFLSSKPRTAFEALQLAHTQISGTMQKVPAAIELNLVYTATDNSLPANNGLYYVYNKAVNSGFVIISGDDRANTVLGYSDSGSFDINQVPDGLKYWLEGYSLEIKSILNTPDIQPVQLVTKSNNTGFQKVTATSVAPLLGDIKWNQGSPYNNLCPFAPGSTTTRCVTGCVATAMAQVMGYYKWPVSGIGSNTYTSKTNSFTLSVNFSQTQYDWANMNSTYSSTSTAVQNNAVATLMYHCGVAVNMDYALSSSASTTLMAKSLISNFGYDPNLQVLLRNYYTRAEISDILKSELTSLRPILYSGLSVDGGHQFVCDGFDSNGYFHFNWGWGGLSNGYFELSALNPGSQGIGGSSGGYNRDQSITIGIQKPTANSVPRYIMYSNSLMTSSLSAMPRTGTVTITPTSFYNNGINVFAGNIGLALYKDSVLVQTIKTYSGINLQAGYGWASYTMSSVSVPASIANGNYKLYLVYKGTNESNWQIVRTKVGTPNYLNVEVTTTNVNITAPTNVLPLLTLNSLIVTGNIYQNKIGRIAVNITNTGNEYNSKIGIQLKSKLNSSVYQLLTEDANITSGETKSYYFNDSIKLAPGDYEISALYDSQNKWTSTTTLTTIGNIQNITIATAPTATPNLTLMSPISFPNTLAVQKDNAVLSATIKNTSGYFDQDLIAFVFPSTGGSSLTYMGYQLAIFDTNEQKTVTFGNSINLATNTSYKIAIYYWNTTINGWTRLTPSSNASINFTLIDNISAVNTPKAIEGFDIFPNPAINSIRFNSDVNVRSVQIFDASGKLVLSNQPKTVGIITLQVENLKSGNYIVQLNTDNGFKIGKFSKR
ncbi:MAG: thiol protease/hemagglutinin PrtT [Paludibacter sp.]